MQIEAPYTQGMDVEKWKLGKTLELTQVSRRDRGQIRAKSTKCLDPSVDGKILDNVTGNEPVGIVKPVSPKP